LSRGPVDLYKHQPGNFRLQCARDREHHQRDASHQPDCPFFSGRHDGVAIHRHDAGDGPYLSKDGAQYFALVNSTGGYATDLSAVSFGSVPLVNGGDSGTIFYVDFVSGTGILSATSSSLGSINCGSLAEPVGYTSALRCKTGPAIVSVGPLAETGELAVYSGASITITGFNFGSQCAGGCRVLATPTTSTTPQQLVTTAWTSTSIKANLPASLTGLIAIEVLAAAGNDTIAVLAIRRPRCRLLPAACPSRERWVER